MADWLHNNFAWVITETPTGLLSCLSDLQLNSADCLNLSKGNGEVFDATNSIISYHFLTPETDFDLFLTPGYQLPQKVQQQSGSSVQQTISTASEHEKSIALKGIVIDHFAFNNDDYREKLLGLIKQAGQKNIPVIVLSFIDEHKHSISKWLTINNLDWVIKATLAELPKCLSELQLNPNICLNLSAGDGGVYEATYKTTSYVMLTPETDYEVFLTPEFGLSITLDTEKVVKTEYKDRFSKLLDKSSKVGAAAEALKVKLCTDAGVDILGFSQMKDVQMGLNKDNGCLTVKLNIDSKICDINKIQKGSIFRTCFALDQEGNLVGEFNNLDELKPLFEVCGLNSKPRDIHVKLLKNDSYLGKDELVEQLQKLKAQVPTILQFLMEDSDDSELEFYLYDGDPAQLIQLDNLNNCLKDLGLYNNQTIKPNNEKFLVINAEILRKNCEAFYQELCSGYMPPILWKKVQSCPEVFNLSNVLYDKLTAGIEGITGKKRTLPQIEINMFNHGINYTVSIILPKELAEDAVKKAQMTGSNEFFASVFTPYQSCALSNFTPDEITKLQKLLGDDDCARIRDIVNPNSSNYKKFFLQAS